MDTVISAPRPARPPPHLSGAVPWLRRNLFADRLNGLITLAVAALLALAALAFFRWGVVQAVLRPDAEACRALDHGGACWGVVSEKFRLILFGRYPFDAQWRPLLAMLLLGAVLVGSAAQPSRGRLLAVLWGIVLTLDYVLMAGGITGLAPVASELWGGLPLTLLLSVGSVGLAFPLALLLAFGRRSRLPAVRLLCGLYVEAVRALPLVSVLFLAAFLIPLTLPEGHAIDKLLRVLAGIALFAAAYLAEVVRGGLQSVPRGQLEAAAALGLADWQTRLFIVLPQALRTALPSLINSFIGALKETSLVTVVSLYELTGSLSLALGGDPDWRPFFLEGYLFIGAIYWCFCFALSRYSLAVERRLRDGRPGREQRP